MNGPYLGNYLRTVKPQLSIYFFQTILSTIGLVCSALFFHRLKYITINFIPVAYVLPIVSLIFIILGGVGLFNTLTSKHKLLLYEYGLVLGDFAAYYTQLSATPKQGLYTLKLQLNNGFHSIVTDFAVSRRDILEISKIINIAKSAAVVPISPQYPPQF